MRVLYDTNVLIDYLNGISAARTEFAKHKDAAISVITWMEVMAGAKDEEEASIRSFLGAIGLVPLSAEVVEQAVIRRRERRLKLPDAIIYATAEIEGRLLITRNSRDFAEDDPGVRIPYRL